MFGKSSWTPDIHVLFHIDDEKNFGPPCSYTMERFNILLESAGGDVSILCVVFMQREKKLFHTFALVSMMTFMIRSLDIDNNVPIACHKDKLIKYLSLLPQRMRLDKVENNMHHNT